MDKRLEIRRFGSRSGGKGGETWWNGSLFKGFEGFFLRFGGSGCATTLSCSRRRGSRLVTRARLVSGSTAARRRMAENHGGGKKPRFSMFFDVLLHDFCRFSTVNAWIFGHLHFRRDFDSLRSGAETFTMGALGTGLRLRAPHGREVGAHGAPHHHRQGGDLHHSGRLSEIKAIQHAMPIYT